jgi:thymidylate synthase (FAD)
MSDPNTPADSSNPYINPPTLQPGRITILPGGFQVQHIRPLIGKRVDVGSDGFIELVDYMGNDACVCNAARVSYGNHRKTFADASDERLMRRLMRERHTTPFEMGEVKFLVRVPMDDWRQWIRTRTASVSEYSTRYKDAIDVKRETHPDEWRLQSKVNKQGSSGMLTDWPEGWYWDSEEARVVAPPAPGTDVPRSWYLREFKGMSCTPGEFASYLQLKLHKDSDYVYKAKLELGIAREQARGDLPLSNYTEAYWKIDLHNLLHFLSLRMDSHAQKEIRDYANVIGTEFIAHLFPMAWQAFLDYRFKAITFSGPETAVMFRALQYPSRSLTDRNGSLQSIQTAEQVAQRLETDSEDERDQFEYKLARIGYHSDKYDGKPPFIG